MMEHVDQVTIDGLQRGSQVRIRTASFLSEAFEDPWRAIEEGADFIETDILSSKDGVLICFHDVTLDHTTDVVEHKEFANRKRTYEVQGANMTGFFTGKFPIITFEEFISIALDASRIVAIYLEIENPVFINQHVKWSDGKKFEDKFVETLNKYGYGGTYMSKDWLKQPVFIQSFAPTSLVYIDDRLTQNLLNWIPTQNSLTYQFLHLLMQF